MECKSEFYRQKSSVHDEKLFKSLNLNGKEDEMFQEQIDVEDSF